VSDNHYLSIGEVLGLLLEDFPDVTISKIRFLESQGLIEPERTPSGYRKFYEQDVDLLRAILHEQRENFLPLKVIRDRIESGGIQGDPTGVRTPPRGIRNVDTRPAPGRTRRHPAHPARNR
jgi:DNA-binding transcriptional MerR regulator